MPKIKDIAMIMVLLSKFSRYRRTDKDTYVRTDLREVM